jgi:hypothetical protein
MGKRHGCPQRECDVDLCETCLSNNKHEHSLTEYLISTNQYSVEQFCKSVPRLLNPKNNEEIEAKTMELKVLDFIFLLIGIHLVVVLQQN